MTGFCLQLFVAPVASRRCSSVDLAPTVAHPTLRKFSYSVNGPQLSSLDCAQLEVHVSIGQLHFASMPLDRSRFSRLRCAGSRVRYWTNIREGLRTLRA